jgi:uncharacterized protein (TIGR04255 family)
VLLKFNNPPVTQTSIGFTFEQGEFGRPWSADSALAFITQYKSTFPRFEASYQRRVDIQEVSPDRLPKIVNQEITADYFRAFNDERTDWLQIARDKLVRNRTRGGGAYLGYNSLRDAALGNLAAYVEHFRPAGLQSAELYYVDQIDIPIPAEKKIELKQYFELRVEIPPEFGPVSHFSTRLFLSPGGASDVVEVKFQSEPSIPEANAYRFRIDWRMICSEIAVFDAEVVKQRLDAAHDRLSSLFRKSLTLKAFALFEPSEDE